MHGAGNSAAQHGTAGDGKAQQDTTVPGCCSIGIATFGQQQQQARCFLDKINQLHEKGNAAATSTVKLNARFIVL
jgi:hypothetical protein